MSSDPTEPHACASVVIPALNEAARIAQVIRHALADPATAEVIVIDDSSIDDTAVLARQAGATVVTSSMLGKGASMRDGVGVARHELIVYLDGDLAGLRDHIVTDLCRPLFRDEADFVKARFGRGGGRVTELTAKPMLKVFFPELADFSQPLGGLIAARASLLKALDFEDGYGVDIGLLIDAQRAGARLAEIDIGSLENDSQPLLDLTAMANEVSRVIYSRARLAGRLHMEQIAAMYECQRQATATLDYVLTRRRARRRVILLDMDATIASPGYIVELARATGHQTTLAGILDGPESTDERHLERLASIFRFVHRKHFERVAHALPIRAGVIECVNRMRRAGFMVGVIGDTFFLGAEILRRRIFADFAMAHTLQFESDICSGGLRRNPALEPVRQDGDERRSACRMVRRFRQDDGVPAVEAIWAVGSIGSDPDWIGEADRAFVIDEGQAGLYRTTAATRLDSYDDLAALAETEAKAAGQPLARPA